ncbi:MAG: hypothetical protein GY801_08010 [bacterium]|nr:hypothetical protein [bacterium]
MVIVFQKFVIRAICSSLFDRGFLQGQSKVRFSFPSDKEENQILGMQTGVIEATFVFQRIQEIEGKGGRVQAEQGSIVFNGQTLEVGVPVMMFPPDRAESPVIPPAPESPKPEGHPASSPMP